MLRHWRVSAHTIARLESEGRLEGLQVGQRVYYSDAKLTELLGQPVVPTSTQGEEMVAGTDRYGQHRAA